MEGGGGRNVLCQVGVLEMRWRREWCVISGGRARDEMEEGWRE